MALYLSKGRFRTRDHLCLLSIGQRHGVECCRESAPVRRRSFGRRRQVPGTMGIGKVELSRGLAQQRCPHARSLGDVEPAKRGRDLHRAGDKGRVLGCGKPASEVGKIRLDQLEPAPCRQPGQQCRQRRIGIDRSDVAMVPL